MKLKTYNRKIDKFLKDLDYLCQENAVQVIFTNRNYVKCNGTKTGGYFDDNKRELACAFKTSNSEWISVLVHESCHLDQWREKNEIWKRFNELNIDQDDWLNHKIELSKDQIEAMTEIYKENEWDCEKRSVEKIKKYDLPIDISNYIKQSVIYVMFYDFVGKYRTWYKNGKSPCCNDEIVNTISPDYDLNILPILTPQIEKLMVEYVLGVKNNGI